MPLTPNKETRYKPFLWFSALPPFPSQSRTPLVSEIEEEKTMKEK
uniref:Uncharacterized protein n=1 Tax=Rhizophora mucronata TaxID=61149 RepID=A0A2P2P3C6_RHIMU